MKMHKHDGCRGCIYEFDLEEKNKDCEQCKYNFRDMYVKREGFKQEYRVEERLVKIEQSRISNRWYEVET